MQNLINKLPSDAVILEPLEPLGRAVKLFFGMFNPHNLTGFNFRLCKKNCIWLGEQSFPLVAISSIFVALALTVQTVNEMRDYRAQDMSGALIALGLLRELGPLTVSLSWSARVAALLSVQAHEFGQEKSDVPFIQEFVLPNYVAGIFMSVPLSAYGLVIGFASSALIAPLLGVSSTNDFLESARLSIKNKDLLVYFTKLILINPTVAVFTACAIGRIHRGDSAHIATNAVTAMFIAAVVANFIVTFLIYIH